MTRIIGLAGRKYAGKNTVADILCELLPTARQYAYADHIKLIVSACLPHLDGLEKEEPCPEYDGLTQRKACQLLGTEWGRACYENVWVDIVNRKIAADDPEYAIITDVRFPNECADIKRQGGTVWKVERPGSHTLDAHVSEQYVDSIPYDVSVRNVGDLTALRYDVERLWYL